MKKKKYEKKILIQFCICLIITISVLIMRNSSDSQVLKYYDKLYNIACHNITISEIRGTAANAAAILKDTPARVVSNVVQVNKEAQYGVPVDSGSNSEDIQQVHSVAGGKVQYVGKNAEKGLFVVIKHEEAVSTYGFLEDVKVIPDERVQRGEVIGNYNPKCGNDFLYDLTSDM